MQNTKREGQNEVKSRTEKVKQGGKTMDFKNKIDDLRVSTSNWLFEVSERFHQKQYYAPDFRKAEQSLEYLTWLARFAQTMQIPEVKLREKALVDNSWIQELIENTQFVELSDRQRKANEKKIEKLGLLRPMEKYLQSLNLADDLILVVGLLEEIQALENAWCCKRVRCEFAPENKEHNRLARAIQCTGDCLELRAFKTIRAEYRDMIDKIELTYSATRRELDEIREQMYNLAFEDLKEESESTREVTRSIMGWYLATLNNGLSGLPFYAPEKFEQTVINQRRLLAPVHRADRDAFFADIMQTYYLNSSQIAEYLKDFAKIEETYQWSLRALKDKFGPTFR